MPSSLLVGALVLAWLVVLVPMIARKRQVVARTAESALAARVVQRTAGSDAAAEETQVPEAENLSVADDESTAELPLPEEREQEQPPAEFEQSADELAEEDERADYYEADEDTELEDELPPSEEDDYVTRPYRPGRGGYNAEAAELAAAAKYALRRKIVFGLLIAIAASVILAIAIAPIIYWATGALGVTLVGYLTYLRRQVRIENDIRARRAARQRPAQHVEEEQPEQEPAPEVRHHTPTLTVHPGATVVDHDDEDPAFAELDDPEVLPYRRAAGQ
ncbi:divisome protein SepX/GlpR [Sciscionella sediminilitoris]|uniref:divisome protein SepX/GlpR n=1 Tax=Sciscionella sediminilitoris TaxID=1445613 RepID=UPI0004DFBCA3|nr:gephyrin-like molybdotransferase receptor GlpR [Sciscionella sp. SE31]